VSGAGVVVGRLSLGERAAGATAGLAFAAVGAADALVLFHQGRGCGVEVAGRRGDGDGDGDGDGGNDTTSRPARAAGGFAPNDGSGGELGRFGSFVTASSVDVSGRKCQSILPAAASAMGFVSCY